MTTRPARLLAAALLALAPCPMLAQTTGPGTLSPGQELARGIYEQLIQVNTADSATGTTPAIEAVARRFLSVGFAPSDVQILTPAGKPTQANLVVRYRGRQPAAGKPLLLMAHMDVVPALASDWTVPPFTLTEKDGWFYGRGSIDDKAMAAIFVANLIRARQGGWVPSRDVILVLAADEETGSEDGMQWLVNNHRARIDAAYAINEGANGDLSNGRPASLGVQAAEKVPVTFTLTVTNRGGFSGLPRSDNAIYQLANGLVHLSHYTFPSQLNDVTRAYFTRKAAVESTTVAAAMRTIVRNPSDPAALKILSARPNYNAMLRTTCVATQLAAGHASNALAQTATATVNCRMLPGTTVRRGGADPGPGAGRHGDPGERRAAPERGPEPGAAGDAGHDRAGDGAGVRRGRAGDPDDGRGRHRRGVPPRRGDPDLRDERALHRPRRRADPREGRAGDGQVVLPGAGVPPPADGGARRERASDVTTPRESAAGCFRVPAPRPLRSGPYR